MKEYKSHYPCPNCGEHKLVHPRLNFEYILMEFLCISCEKNFTVKEVRKLNDECNCTSDEFVNPDCGIHGMLTDNPFARWDIQRWEKYQESSLDAAYGRGKEERR